MKTVEDYERIRKAHYVEGLSIREICRRFHHGRNVVKKALKQAEASGYQLKEPRPAPVLSGYKAKIDALLLASKQQPRKQRYTGHKIYEMMCAEGYQGSEGTIQRYVSQQRKVRKQRQAYLPLEFSPGEDAQVDWGEAVVEIGGERQTVQIFVMRLNYSKARFVTAFPFQKQEAFFEGHIQAFRFFGGVPRRITYDNLKTAVFRVLEGHNRQEQTAFRTFRSYYLFESHYCTPAQGHEKGGVESDVGYVQRNFFAPIPQVKDFAELNARLRQNCLNNMQRRVRGEDRLVVEVWTAEKTALLPLAATDYRACSSHPVKANPYSQVVFETNRYSVPTEYVGKQLALRAYPFRVEILSNSQVVAEHNRCLGREQDVLDPQHYLTLLEQRPAAFEYALPMRRLRRELPETYERLLESLREQKPNGQGIREFIAILKLHRSHPPEVVHRAVNQAVKMGAANLDGVQLCLRELLAPQTPPPALNLAHSKLAAIGNQPISLEQYNQLLSEK